MTTFDRSNLAQTAIVVAATLAATALAGAMLAYWTWIWLAPRQESLMRPTGESVNAVAAAGGLFGIAEPGRIPASSATGPIRLLGLVAASPGRRGYAVLQLEARRIVAVPEGGEISPGVRLVEVAADHAVLERGGARESIAWPRKEAPAGSPAPQSLKK